MKIVDAVINQKVVSMGFRLGTSLENRAAFRLGLWGHDSSFLAQQHRVGPYRLDFAWTDVLVALEVDGWHHRRPENAARDTERDAWLRAQEWLIFRVDDLSDVDVQLSRVSEIVHALRSMRGLDAGRRRSTLPALVRGPKS